jgi:hypothetical protein
VSSRDPFRPRTTLGGLTGPLSQDLVAILALLFVTYSFQFFQATALIPSAMRLGPLTWRALWLWEVATYPFAGWGAASLWFPVQLLILYWFGRDVFSGLRRKHFWRLIAWSTLVAAAIAIATDVVQASLGQVPAHPVYPILQGQQLLMAVFITAFATANRDAQILLFFVLPIRARFFIAIEIVIAFVAFLESHDLPGFLGLCAAVAIAYVYVRDGGIGRGLRQTRLRIEKWWLQRKLTKERRKRGFRVVPGGGGSDSYLH